MSVDRKESDARVPGWTLLKAPGKGVRYRAPDGSEVGYYAYKSALTHYEKTGVAPQSPLGTRWMQYQKDGASIFSQGSHERTSMRKEINIPDTDETLVLDLPEPKSTPSSRTKSGLFSAKELSDGAITLLVILTSLIAVSTQLPEAQMSEIELKAIAVPLGNIVERSKYNRAVGSLIVGKSDYLTLGYALYVYIDRVSSAARERKQHATHQPIGNAGQAQGNYGAYTGTAAGVSNGNIGPLNGIALRAAPSGLRGYTPNG